MAQNEPSRSFLGFFYSAAATAFQQPNKPTTLEVEHSCSISAVVGLHHTSTTPQNEPSRSFLGFFHIPQRRRHRLSTTQQAHNP